VFKLIFVYFYTGFTLVDDAYITARYGFNLVTSGQFVYNLDEYVFGVTTPLYSLILAFAYSIFGSHLQIFVIFFNITLWSASALILYRFLKSTENQTNAALIILFVFLFYPAFIDNQYLGMETSLFVFLMLLSVRGVHSSKDYLASGALGLLFITRPEGVLFAPALLMMYSFKNGNHKLAEVLSSKRNWMLLIIPSICWYSFSFFYYGSIIPQSMVAKSAWNSEHYNSLVDLSYVLNTIPRLTFFPFVDIFPQTVRHVISISLIVLIVGCSWFNYKFGSWISRGFLAFYCIYITFYILGKGATEASWYAIPSSVAMLISLYPIVDKLSNNALKLLVPFVLVVCLATSTFSSMERSKVLAYYIDYYGQSAVALNQLLEDEGEYTRAKVLIGEIGVYGFLSDHYIIDVGALVSPYMLELKNQKGSLIGLIRDSEAGYFVIDSSVLEDNYYPSVGKFYSSPNEWKWFLDNCELIITSGPKLTYKVIN